MLEPGRRKSRRTTDYDEVGHTEVKSLVSHNRRFSNSSCDDVEAEGNGGVEALLLKGTELMFGLKAVGGLALCDRIHRS